MYVCVFMCMCVCSVFVCACVYVIIIIIIIFYFLLTISTDKSLHTSKLRTLVALPMRIPKSVHVWWLINPVRIILFITGNIVKRQVFILCVCVSLCFNFLSFNYSIVLNLSTQVKAHIFKWCVWSCIVIRFEDQNCW